MWDNDTSGGGTARKRSTSASRSGSWGASCGSTFGASGAGPDPEEAVALAREPLAEPRGRLLHPPVLGEPPRELLGGRLRLELGELGRLLREQAARLQLQQRRDEHEELAARVEVELIPLREPLDEREHDGGDVDVPQVELVLEDERQEQVEGALERVKVELELADDHPADPKATTGRAPSGPPSAAPSESGAAAPSASPPTSSAGTATRRRTRARRRGTTSETQKLTRWPRKWLEGSMRSVSSYVRNTQ